MMMDDFLGNIQGGGGDPPPAAALGLGGGVGGGMDDLVDLDFFMGLENSQNSIGESFLTGLSHRVQESTSMMLSDEEKRWARELQGAVKASEENNVLVDHLTDMEIVQYALVAEGHVLHALQRIHTLQAFKKAYDIDDTVAQGMECIAALLDQQDGHFLDVDTNPQTQESVIVVDLQAFFPQRALQINNTKCNNGADYHWKVLARGYYYLCRACTPSLASVRHGLFLVADCHGMKWDNFDLECNKRIHAELLGAYPIRYKKVMAYHTALVANVCWGLVKRLASDEVKQAVELGCRLVDTDAAKPPRRMAELYQQPNAKALRQKVLRRVGELLDERDVHEQEYQLQQ
jgi:hypothetical protein